MNNYKPIETRYNGYRFRSRLEARWAVFFDAAGIEYQYEPEGFEYPETWESKKGECVCSGDVCDIHERNEDCILVAERIRYLPDFYLPELETYVEVKPEYDDVLKIEAKIARCIDWGYTPIAKGLLILGEIPYYKLYAEEMPSFLQYYHDEGVSVRWVAFKMSTDGKPELHKGPVIDCDGSGEGIPDVANSSEAIYEVDRWKTDEDRNHFCHSLYRMDRFKDFCYSVNNFYQPCFLKARQARFEYGETP